MCRRPGPKRTLGTVGQHQQGRGGRLQRKGIRAKWAVQRQPVVRDGDVAEAAARDGRLEVVPIRPAVQAGGVKHAHGEVKIATKKSENCSALKHKNSKKNVKKAVHSPSLEVQVSNGSRSEVIGKCVSRGRCSSKRKSHLEERPGLHRGSGLRYTFRPRGTGGGQGMGGGAGGGRWGSTAGTSAAGLRPATHDTLGDTQTTGKALRLTVRGTINCRARGV